MNLVGTAEYAKKANGEQINPDNIVALAPS